MAVQEELLLLEQREEIQCLDLSQIQRKIVIHNKILEDEEAYWFKRAHTTWLHQGDNNTEFFHRVANNRRRRNTIISLHDGATIIEGATNLVNHATEFYKSLFGPAPGNVFPLSEDLWDPNEKVYEEDNTTLIKPFSESEIKNALFQMEKNKAAGPDKIPIEFYQHCWEIIKEDIIELFTDFHEGRLDVSRMNYGIITLLSQSSGC